MVYDCGAKRLTARTNKALDDSSRIIYIYIYIHQPLGRKFHLNSDKSKKTIRGSEEKGKV